MPFTILYEGLICHVNDGGVETSVFMAGPAQPKHELRLVVENPTDVVHSTFASDRTHAVSPSAISFKISNHVLSMSGVVSSPVAVSQAFSDEVPALAELATCTSINSSVRSRKINAAFDGYLDHPSGKFDVDETFPKKGQFGKGPKAIVKCVAKVVRLTLASGTDPVTIAGADGGEFITLRPDATVRIVNKAAAGDPAPTNAHFHHYGSVLAQGCHLLGVVSESDVDCNPAVVNIQVNGGAECSNSHIP